tara:strand:+ start:388 stop:639 length:252 start_codon:yes stop_codon:yes gene_type:complete
MIKKRNITLVFGLLIGTIFINFKITRYENDILYLKKEKERMQIDLDLKEINWTYVIKPGNLELINNESHFFEPIKLEDIINLE